ncbi:hypothetical protein [Pseudooceanicola onchidii]|uniref:hypothetical protein n=1 Tax=Pseudooceanicola onchidii TaxID=2562279 RepID=UPI0010AB161E|nr:hypothetical protein [Pseudooceanicola onchidii]
MSDLRNRLFLGRGSYRQRRLADAARLMPILGGVLLMLPLLWPRQGIGEASEVPPTSSAMIYIFGVWVALVLASLYLSHNLDPTETEARGDDDPSRGG